MLSILQLILTRMNFYLNTKCVANDTDIARIRRLGLAQYAISYITCKTEQDKRPLIVRVLVYEMGVKEEVQNGASV